MKKTRAFSAGMLVLATALWALSFPVAKALWMIQTRLVPGIDSWFLASLSLSYRFLAAFLILAVFSRKALRKISRLDVEQGLGLGVFGGIGMLFQMDGLSYTHASTSAFLTQCYCVLIPIWKVIFEKQKISLRLLTGIALVVWGVSILSDVNWKNFSIGRGEWETIIASLFFGAQILWLERKKYKNVNSTNSTLVMFFSIAVLLALMSAFSAKSLSDLYVPYFHVSTALLMLAIVLSSTLGAFWLMNTYQSGVDATEAGLIYCVESVNASFFALFLPGLFSTLFAIQYPSEKLTYQLCMGGALILIANVIVLTERKKNVVLT